jgi:hypothetical protein
MQNSQVKAGLTDALQVWPEADGSDPSDQDPAAQVAIGRGGVGLTGADSSQNWPDLSDRDRAVPDARMSPGGGGRPAVARLRRRKATGRRHKGDLGLGCPFHRGDYTRSMHTSTRTQQGGRRSGGDVARRGGAVNRGGVTPATPLRRCRAQGRQQAAHTGPSPCSKPSATFSVTEKVADGRFTTAAVALGFAVAAASSGARVSRWKGVARCEAAVRNDGEHLAKVILMHSSTHRHDFPT